MRECDYCRRNNCVECPIIHSTDLGERTDHFQLDEVTDNNKTAPRKNNLKRLYEAIDFSKERFEELKHKNWDWESFHNGVIEYWSFLERKKIDEREQKRKESK
jgi:hypothetical protein